MRTLSQAAEEKLLAAIEKAAAYVNDGMAPNAAIIKSASESNIPSGHINLMVHAYNTGRTTKQRESGENTLEKAADFALADADTVLDALFPKQVKTSQAIEREAVVSTEYAVSPKGLLARRIDQQQKAASAQHIWPASTYVRPPRDDKEEARRQYSQKVAEQRDYEELRRVAASEYQKAAAAMEELHTYFRRPGNMSFGDAVAETELRIGGDGVSVLKKVAAVYPHLEKQASTNLAHFGPCEPCDLVSKVLSAVAQYNDAQKQADLKKKPIAPQFGKKAASNILTESILAEAPPLTLKQAAIPGMDTIYLSDGSEQKIISDPAFMPSPEQQLAGHVAGYRPVGGPRLKQERPAPPVRTDTIRLSDGSEQKVVVDPAYHPTFEEQQKNRDLIPGFRPLGAAAPPRPERPERPQYETIRLPDGSEQKVVVDPTFEPTRRQQRLYGAMPGLRPVGSPYKKEERQFLPEGAVPPPQSVLPDIASNPIGAITKILDTPVSGRGVAGGVRGLGTSLAKSMTTPISDAEVKARTQGAFKALTDPDHELQLRGIRAKSVLNDLIRNDPVISSYDPAEVTLGFNEISEVAPSVAESPAVMTALLRKRLEAGQLADFDINQLMQMEASKAQTQNYQLNSKRVQRDLIE